MHISPVGRKSGWSINWEHDSKPCAPKIHFQLEETPKSRQPKAERILLHTKNHNTHRPLSAPPRIGKEDVTNKSPLLLENNPVYKMIPVLIHGQNAVSESLFILEYIDETWKENPILPADPTERAYARFWAKFSEEKILEPSRLAFHYTGKNQAEGVKLMSEGLQILEGEIRGKKFFGGEAFGYLDIVVGWIAYWLHFSQEAAGYKAMDPASIDPDKVLESGPLAFDRNLILLSMVSEDENAIEVELNWCDVFYVRR
ncbi:putative glutathione S-transferase [Sesamum angolense]|uniref:Glutathione S-transferase n=1 Tax=Sesamum angolense TaxID=2727404 RepID=A0AAE1T553_9LAMI|nr:putative glutathione S-transferase [Sesamum angolense]